MICVAVIHGCGISYKYYLISTQPLISAHPKTLKLN